MLQPKPKLIGKFDESFLATIELLYGTRAKELCIEYKVAHPYCSQWAALDHACHIVDIEEGTVVTVPMKPGQRIGPAIFKASPVPIAA